MKYITEQVAFDNILLSSHFNSVLDYIKREYRIEQSDQVAFVIRQKLINTLEELRDNLLREGIETFNATNQREIK